MVFAHFRCLPFLAFAGPSDPEGPGQSGGRLGGGCSGGGRGGGGCGGAGGALQCEGGDPAPLSAPAD